jgi:hypothetical protein
MAPVTLVAETVLCSEAFENDNSSSDSRSPLDIVCSRGPVRAASSELQLALGTRVG